MHEVRRIQTLQVVSDCAASSPRFIGRGFLVASGIAGDGGAHVRTTRSWPWSTDCSASPTGLVAIGLVLTQSSNEILWYIGLFGIGVFFTSLGRP